MGGNRRSDQDSAKKQILEILDYNVLESLSAMGTDLDRLCKFWCDYVQFLREGYNPVEAFQKLKLLRQYQMDEAGFNYFCYLGLKTFTDKVVEETDEWLS